MLSLQEYLLIDRFQNNRSTLHIEANRNIKSKK